MDKTVVLVENDWTNWRSFTTSIEQEPGKTKKALLRAGGMIRRRLRLRTDPFVFRSINGKPHFKAAGVAGTLTLENVSLNILPKFAKHGGSDGEWDASSLFLLEALNGRHVLCLATTQRRWRCHSVLDLIGHAFADSVERGLRDRPICIYRPIEESAVALRGRLNLSRQIRNWNRTPHLLECDSSALDTDNSFNDVLKWAASTLTRAVHETKLRARLRTLLELLPGRVDRAARFLNHRLSPPPQFRVWTDALELARLLARGLVESSGGGRAEGYSMLFNMERAFERFVEYGLSQAIRSFPALGLTCERQQTMRYAKPLSPRTKALYCRPDNVVRRHGIPIAIVDAKYKLLDSHWNSQIPPGTHGSPSSSDLYELLVGMLAHGCFKGLLVYPSAKVDTPNISDVRKWTVSVFDCNFEVSAVPINLRSLSSRDTIRDSFAVVQGCIVEMINTHQ